MKLIDYQKRALKKLSKKGKGEWFFELSSGYAGYRCNVCGHWVYEDAERKCNCDEA